MTQNQAFAMARERERIGIFLAKTLEFGVPDTNLFQTDYLYERTNLVQVCTCIRAIGIEVCTAMICLIHILCKYPLNRTLIRQETFRCSKELIFADFRIHIERFF